MAAPDTVVTQPWHRLRSLVHRTTDDYQALCRPCILLLLGLYANTKLSASYPVAWGLIPLLLAIALMRARFGEAETSVIRLWQLIGVSSALYSLLHFPLMPLAHHDAAGVGLYTFVILAWLSSVLSGILCYRVPSLSILPPAFLTWVNSIAESVTGLRTTIHIDVQPLTEVSVCIGLGLLIIKIHPRFDRVGSERPGRSAEARPSFAGLLLLIAVAVHLANYFWSFCAKISLDGPVGAWLTQNNPAYMFLVALDDGHIFYAAHASLTHGIFRFFDITHVYSNFCILAIQAAALVAFFLPRKAFFALLVMFDVMHVAIITLAGANFWPWIILNVMITVAIASSTILRQPLGARLLASSFILLAPHFVHVARLGWYDTGANNKLYFDAVDGAGQRYQVPTNFFTFYSYSFGHMDYGSPEPASAFAVSSPNGAAYDYEMFLAGRHCDVEKLSHSGQRADWNAGELSAFVKAYHRLALAVDSRLGRFPYDLYPHHFYVPLTNGAAFRQLDRTRIVAYIYRRESVCLSYAQGQFRRRLFSVAEYRIDVN